MRVNRLSPDIYEIEDFVSIEEQKIFLNFCKSLKDSDWWTKDSPDADFFNGKTTFKNPELFKNLYIRVCSIFSNYDEVSPLSLHRHLDKDFMLPHMDWSPEYFKNSVNYLRYGLIVYYNDDYDGGSLNYPDLGIVHKPKARSLMIHGGHILHGTTRVTGANRYFSTTFVFGKKEKPVTLNKDIFGDVEQSDNFNYF